MKAHLLLLSIVTLTLLGSLSLVLCHKFRRNEIPWKIIAIFLVGSFLAQGISTLFWVFGINNLTVLHVFSLFQFLALSAFYWSATSKAGKKKVILIVSSLVASLLIVNSIWNESLSDFNSIGSFISNGTIVFYAIAYFFEALGDENDLKKYLIINSGILLFACESLVVFLFGNFLMKVDFIDQVGLWYTHAIAYIIFLLLILWNHVKLNR